MIVGKLLDPIYSITELSENQNGREEDSPHLKSPERCSCLSHSDLIILDLSLEHSFISQSLSQVANKAGLQSLLHERISEAELWTMLQQEANLADRLQALSSEKHSYLGNRVSQEVVLCVEDIYTWFGSHVPTLAALQVIAAL